MLGRPLQGLGLGQGQPWIGGDPVLQDLFSQ